MQRTAVRVTLTLFFTLSAMVGASAQDIKGGRDHPLVKRFPGSTLVRYDKQNSAVYTLPTGPVVKWDYVKGQPDFAGRRLELEGDLTRITYVVRPGPTSAEVCGSLRKELMAKGFKPLYEAKGAEFGKGQGNLYQNLREQLVVVSRGWLEMRVA